MHSHTELRTRLLAFTVGFIFVIKVSAADAAGFREISVNGVQAGIWYPSNMQTTNQRFGPFDVEIARNAPIQRGNHKLILFSHGNSGFYRNHYLTAQALADAGFVVVAPQHEADYLIGGPQTAQALDHRYLELATALNAIVTDPEFGDHVTTETVHGLGYSLGGATILLAAGAEFASDRATQHCRQHRQSDAAFCEDQGRIYRLMESFQHNVNLRKISDPFQNAPLINGKVVLVAPVYQGVGLTPPPFITALTVFAIEGDLIAKPKFHAYPLLEAISRDIPSDLQTLSGHHYAFIAPFPKWLTEEEDIPVAKDPKGFDRSAFLKELNERIVAIFLDS